MSVIVPVKEHPAELQGVCMRQHGMQVDHPNCIKLHAIFETEKRVFIVTELVSGGELLDRCLASLLGTAFDL